MKLIDAIKNVDRSPENTAHGIDIGETFAPLLNLSYYSYVESTRLTRHHLTRWICTDSWVGLFVYYLDDEPIAIGDQNARKSDEIISFLSQEAADKLRDYILTLIREEEDGPSLQMINPDEEIGDSYSVAYGSQLLTDEGFIWEDDSTKLPVKVTKKFGLRYESPSSEWSKVEVTLPSGEVRKIDIDNFRIPYMLKKEKPND